METQREVTIHKPRKEILEETKPADTLFSDFQPPEM
jgi:hypothetical protein